MPTKQQMEAAAQRIEWLESMSYLREEGKPPEPASDTVLPRWEDLDRTERQTVLDTWVDWKGFSEAQKFDVEQRVLDGQSANFWMDGITPDRPGEHRGTKTYQVFHQRDVSSSQFPEDYVHVANVQANGLREAVDLTNDRGGTPDDPGSWMRWEWTPQVDPCVVNPRDTLPGDVVVDPQGNAYRLEREGDAGFFKDVAVDIVQRGDDLALHGGSVPGLFAEMRADYSARAAEDRPEDAFQRTLEEYATQRLAHEPQKGLER